MVYTFKSLWQDTFIKLANTFTTPRTIHREFAGGIQKINVLFITIIIISSIPLDCHKQAGKVALPADESNFNSWFSGKLRFPHLLAEHNEQCDSPSVPVRRTNQQQSNSVRGEFEKLVFWCNTLKLQLKMLASHTGVSVQISAAPSSVLLPDKMPGKQKIMPQPLTWSLSPI